MVRGPAARDIAGMNSDTRILNRSTDDKMIAGVAGGLGEYFGVDPVLFRVGFVAATLLSGVGALAYLALVLFVKTDDDEDIAVPAGRAKPRPAGSFRWEHSPGGRFSRERLPYERSYTSSASAATDSTILEAR